MNGLIPKTIKIYGQVKPSRVEMVKRARDTEWTSWYLSQFKYNSYKANQTGDTSMSCSLETAVFIMAITVTAITPQYHQLKTGDIYIE